VHLQRSWHSLLTEWFQSLIGDELMRSATRALILVPTRELSEQVTAYLRGLLAYCDKDVILANAASGTTTHLQRYVHDCNYSNSTL
jgi:superfamily II DNA/RNA helicase